MVCECELGEGKNKAACQLLGFLLYSFINTFSILHNEPKKEDVEEKEEKEVVPGDNTLNVVWWVLVCSTHTQYVRTEGRSWWPMAPVKREEEEGWRAILFRHTHAIPFSTGWLSTVIHVPCSKFHLPALRRGRRGKKPSRTRTKEARTKERP